MINREIKREILSYDEMQFLIKTLIDSVDLEINRITVEKDRNIVIDYLTRVYLNTQYFAFFVDQNLEVLTENIMESSPVRDFIMNLTDRVSVIICYDEETMDRLIKTIASAYCRNKPEDSNHSLIIKEINDSISINADALKELLRNNFWISLMYLLTFNLHQTVIIQSSE